ncbi:MAG TPA: glycosyltransferase family 2 protein [Actinomycetota bacterium]|nr:glycosyltransferase family 2 protein [Actinomycetota bacterium]
MRISVVIPTLARIEMLRATLESIRRCSPPPFEIIVVDGDDAGGSRDVVSSADAASSFPISYVASERGLTRQRNAGIRAAGGDVILFLDDDVELDPSLFATLSRVYGDAGVVGATGRIVEWAPPRIGRKESRIRRLLPGGGAEGGFTRYGYPRRLVDVETPRDVEFMQGCFMSGRSEDVEAVGFDESLPGYALAEDEDFSFRLSRRGRIRYEPDARLEHKNMGFTTKDPRAFDRQVMVNRTYLFRKNFDPGLLARLQFVLLFFVLVGHRLINREWQGARGLVEGAVEAWRTRGARG